MNLGSIAPVALAAVAAGGVAYVFLYPILSGEKRAEKRHKAVVGSMPMRKTRDSTADRRNQVAQSLKELEDREKARAKVTLEARIAQAGLTLTKKRFFIYSGVAAAILSLVLLITTGNLLLFAGGLLVGGVGMPRWILNYLKKRRIKLFLKELPNAMDVIVRGIKSGLPLGDCIRMIAREAQEPVKGEFRILVEKQGVGISFADAAGSLYERMPVPEANFFGIVIAIQSKAGGNLSEALGNLSRVLRERKKMKDKITSMSQEAKASAMIIGALPFLITGGTYLTSPTYIELLWLTTVGKIALVVAAGWMVTGCLVMKKMINFDF